MFDKSKLRKAYVPVSDSEKAEMRRIHKDGYTLRSIAEAFNRSVSVVHRILKEK